MLFHDLFWLVALHFIADFQLQSDFVARNKVPGSFAGWPCVMSAHAAAHGAAVAFVIDVRFGLAEFLAHWAIDYAKAKGIYGAGSMAFYVDQSIHIGLKLVWLWLASWI